MTLRPQQAMAITHPLTPLSSKSPGAFVETICSCHPSLPGSTERVPKVMVDFQLGQDNYLELPKMAYTALIKGSAEVTMMMIPTVATE